MLPLKEQNVKDLCNKTKKINQILLIDDDEITNLIHGLIIRQSEVCERLQVAYGGREGLDYLTNTGRFSTNEENEYPCPNLIFLDINMPGMNGFDFLDAYSKLDCVSKENSVIIMLSTSELESDWRRAESYEEVKTFMTKPLTEQKLLTILENYF